MAVDSLYDKLSERLHFEGLMGQNMMKFQEGLTRILLFLKRFGTEFAQ